MEGTPVSGNKTRLYNLDYLRGLAAVGVMAFHYSAWTFGFFGADSILGRIGIYAVSIFYVLSGLTLYHVYYHRFSLTFDDLKAFYVKRFFRIFPLLWLVTIATIALRKEIPSLEILFINFTGLFSIYKINSYIAIGAWSIGNELCFYLAFPVFILLLKRNKPAFFGLALVILAIFVYYAFAVVQPTEPRQWVIYINPLNNMMLFLAGILIGHFMSSLELSLVQVVLLLMAGIGIVIFWPASGDRMVLTAGVNRLVFSAACVMICMAFYKMKLRITNGFLVLIGEASYSIYMVHPIVWSICLVMFNQLSKQIGPIPIIVRMGVPMVLTIMAAYLTYLYFEKRFMRIGNSFTSQRKMDKGSSAF